MVPLDWVVVTGVGVLRTVEPFRIGSPALATYTAGVDVTVGAVARVIVGDGVGVAAGVVGTGDAPGVVATPATCVVGEAVTPGVTGAGWVFTGALPVGVATWAATGTVLVGDAVA